MPKQRAAKVPSRVPKAPRAMARMPLGDGQIKRGRAVRGLLESKLNQHG